MLLDLEIKEKEILKGLLENSLAEWEGYKNIKHARMPEDWFERIEKANLCQEILHKLD